MTITIGRRHATWLISITLILVITALSISLVTAGTSEDSISAPLIDIVADIIPSIPESVPESISEANVGVNLDELSLNSAYQAASKLERNAQQIMNSIVIIRDGKSSELLITAEQKVELRDIVFGALNEADVRRNDVIRLLDITQIQLNSNAITNPVRIIVYRSEQATPTPTP